MTGQFLQIDPAKQMTSTREAEEWLRSPQSRHNSEALQDLVSVLEKQASSFGLSHVASRTGNITLIHRFNASFDADPLFDVLQKVRTSIKRNEVLSPAPVTSVKPVLSQKNQELLQLLQSWGKADENEVQEQRATWNDLREALDEDELIGRVSSDNAAVSLDLSPFELQEVDLENSRLRFREPLVLKPFLDGSSQLLVIENEDWELSVFAPTREQLWEELREQIAMLWREYAQEDDDVLSPPALTFKRYLLRHIEELPLGDDTLVS